MTLPTFKVGDFVRVKPDLQVTNERYPSVNPSMLDYRGMEGIITEHTGNFSLGVQCFRLNIDEESYRRWSWANWMLEHTSGEVISVIPYRLKSPKDWYVNNLDKPIRVIKYQDNDFYTFSSEFTIPLDCAVPSDKLTLKQRLQAKRELNLVKLYRELDKGIETHLHRRLAVEKRLNTLIKKEN